MAVKCPKCQFDNTDSARFCSNCAEPLNVAGAKTASLTKTLETPVQVMKPGTVIASKYRIVEEIAYV